MSEKKTIVVFGATGRQGGSVLAAFVKTGQYHLRAITRDKTLEKAKKLAEFNDVTVVEADLDKPKSLDNAMKGAYGVFLVTDFSHHFALREIEQGKNAIDAAIRNGIKHFVFSGLENVRQVVRKPCYHYDCKSEIENYGLSFKDKIIFTSIRLPMYFENFLRIDYLSKVKTNEYQVNIPVSDAEMYGMSVGDFGPCVVSLFQSPDEYKSKVIGVAGDKLKLNAYIDTLNKYLKPIHFYNGNITPEQFSAFGFPGAPELSIMFEYFQTGKMYRDLNLTKKLNNGVQDFDTWVSRNTQNMIDHLQK